MVTGAWAGDGKAPHTCLPRRRRLEMFSEQREARREAAPRAPCPPSSGTLGPSPGDATLGRWRPQHLADVSICNTQVVGEQQLRPWQQGGRGQRLGGKGAPTASPPVPVSPRAMLCQPLSQ